MWKSLVWRWRWIPAVMTTGLLSLPGPGYAEPIEIAFTATVDQIAVGTTNPDPADYIGSGITVGTELSASFVFDSDNIPQGGGPIAGTATHLFSGDPFAFAVTGGGFTFATDPTADPRVIIAITNNLPVGDTYTVASGPGNEVPGQGGLLGFMATPVLALRGDEVRDDFALLLTGEAHSVYPEAQLAIQVVDLVDQDATFIINAGQVQYTVIPEPSAALMMLVGLGAVCRQRRA